MQRQQIEASVLEMLRHLADLDPDNASQRNDVGFNGRDTDLGRSFASQQHLSDRQMDTAFKMLRTYKNTQLQDFPYDATLEAWEDGPEPPAPTRNDNPSALCNRAFAPGTMVAFVSRDSRRLAHAGGCDGNGTAPVSAAPPGAPRTPEPPTTSVAPEDHSRPSWSPQTPLLEVSTGKARETLGPDGPIARSLPGYEPRPEQLDLTDAIDSAIRSRTNLVSEAPTGCLSGDTEMVVNRAGEMWTMPLRTVVFKFNGGHNTTRRGNHDRRFWNPAIPTYVQREEDGAIRLGRVVAAWNSGEKQTFTVRTSTGKEIRATDEHPFLTERGWLRLDELRVGDTIHMRGGRSRAGRATTVRPPAVYAMQSHPFATVKGLGPNNPSKSYSVRKHRLAAEASTNDLPLAAFIDRLRSGQTDTLTFLDPNEAHVHHKDRNPLNNDPSNLEILSKSEHHRRHANDGTMNNVLLQVDLDTVESITPFGSEETFDIEVADEPHNFVAAGFVVHNTGKSLAYSVPAILWAVENDGKVCISTADKSLQEQIVQKDLPFLQDHMGVPFKHAILKGRGNYACHYQIDQIKQDNVTFASADAAAAFPAFLQWFEEREVDGLADIEVLGLPDALRQAVTVDSDRCLGRKCPFFGQCHVERAKGKARQAHVFVVNHALLLRDLQVRYETEGYVSILPDIDILVCDEVHHLIDSATDAFDSMISVGRWGTIAAGIKKLTVEHHGYKQSEGHEGGAGAKRLAEQVTQIDEQLSAYIAAVGERMGKQTSMRLGDEASVLGNLPLGLSDLIFDLADRRPPWLSEDERERWDRYRKMVANFKTALDRCCVEAEPNYVRFAESERTSMGGRRISLHCKPIDVADPLRERLWEAPLTRKDRNNPNAELEPPTVICTSATITSGGKFDYWRRQVGLDNAAEIVVASPFDYRTHALCYLPEDAARFSPKLSYQDATRDAYYQAMARRIEDLILASDGRAFVLCTSYSGMGRLWDLMPQRLRSNYTFMRQGEEGMTRPMLVARFKNDAHAVLFGTASFWEGVDIQGAALSMVIIDKMPFPPPDDIIWSARAESIKARGGNDFAQLSLPYAIIKLKQGVGRLIRSKVDMGVVALLDGRLQGTSYGTQVLRSLPPMRSTTDLNEVQAFFRDPYFLTTATTG